MTRFLTWFSLFTSTGTILCCALPSLLVAIGMGATMAGLVSTFPQLVWLSQHKNFIFSLSAILIVLAFSLQQHALKQACPINPEKARACRQSRKWSQRILWVALFLWASGAFFAFLAPHLF